MSVTGPSVDLPIELSYQEVNLLLFALAGGQSQMTASEPPSCEESCPLVSHLEAALGGDSETLEKRIARHLNDHLREGLIDSGLLGLMDRFSVETDTLSTEDKARVRQANTHLAAWSCMVTLGEVERRVLSLALSRLPKSAWFSMPRTLWRLKRKLKPHV